MAPLLQFFGRLHPMVLHAPIGLLIGWAVLEVLALRGRPLDPRVRATLAWLTAISAVLSAGAGFVLSYEPEYDRSAIQIHQWLGIGVAALCVTAAVLQRFPRSYAFRAALFLAVATVIPAGHLGAGITRGPGYLTAPFTGESEAATTRQAANPAPADSEYALTIAPIFQSRCGSCHGPGKRRGDLALHTPDGIRKGGKSGPILVAGDPDSSEIIRRLRLPIDDEDHMPPQAKAQPTPDEIQAIADWIKAGASFEAPPAAPSPTVPPAPAGPDFAKPSSSQAANPADPAAVKALRDAFVHVEPIQQGSNLLFIDFSAVATTLAETDLTRFLAPVRDQVADLTLARSKAGDDLMQVVAQMPNLTRLNISATAVSDAGIAALAKHPKLEDLILTMDHLTDAAATSLSEMPALKRIYIWKSGLSPEALGALRDRAVTIDTGDAQAAQPLEAETEITLTSGSPAAGPDALKPINTVCPVSGQPIDPRYAVVYKGRVIGFCCSHCPSDFWADPEKYASKLP